MADYFSMSISNSVKEVVFHIRVVLMLTVENGCLYYKRLSFREISVMSFSSFV